MHAALQNDTEQFRKTDSAKPGQPLRRPSEGQPAGRTFLEGAFDRFVHSLSRLGDRATSYAP
jgi:hypothetical protein